MSNDKFLKYDDNKPIISEIEPDYIIGIAQVLTYGAKKYNRGNWKKMTEDDRARIADSLLRHIYSYLKGEKIDKESNLSHLYHASCNLMFLDYLDRNKQH